MSSFITVERSDDMDEYARMIEGFKNDMEEIGFTMDGSSLIAGNRNSLQIGEASDVPNRDLYRIAKCFLRSISRG